MNMYSKDNLKQDYINIWQYQQMVQKAPFMIKWLNLSIEQLKENAKLIMKTNASKMKVIMNSPSKGRKKGGFVERLKV